ncbi:hypothetical protein [Oceanicoccus sp. KOV_DT_Chl]|uniref:hypothetical protein n=1 Tax=Oceanicoccus sp. KOV_DT_Chl TaxID=1904639 RepID=UPI000C7A5AC2|nr:hypothetical protein [Oceanicoccus sp. KOV_DT_Chl]
MILSKENKFVFVKGHKVASTSIEIYLSQFCGKQDIITPVTPIDEKSRLLRGWPVAQNYGVDEAVNAEYIAKLAGLNPDQLASIQIPRGRYYNHMPLREILDAYGDIPQDWTVFAVERCPYRKVISLANMMLNFSEYKKSGADMLTDIDVLKLQINSMFTAGQIGMVKNIDMYKTPAGSTTVRIVRFENLVDEVAKIVTGFGGVEREPIQHYKKGMSSLDLVVEEVFTPTQIQRINEIYKEEFESFGYKMIG